MYCPLGSASPISCPDGFTCTSTTAVPTQCPEGKYRTSSTGACVSCTAGFKCEDKKSIVAVQQGYYSPEGDNHEYLCPAGYACSTNALVACLAGQYSDTGDLYCHDCPAGYACPDTRNSAAKINCITMEGFYGDVIKLTQCKVCPAGSSCSNID